MLLLSGGRRSRAVCLPVLPFRISPRLELRTVFALNSDAGGQFVVMLLFLFWYSVHFPWDGTCKILGSLVKGLSFVFICRCDTTIRKDVDVFLIPVTQTLFTCEVLCTILV